MKWNRNRGNWNQMTGQEKEKLGRTSSDGLSVVEVWRDQLECLLQRRYGYARERPQTEAFTAFDAGLYSLVQHDADVQVRKIPLLSYGTAYEVERAKQFLSPSRVNPSAPEDA